MKVVARKATPVRSPNHLETLVHKIETYQSEIAEHRRKLEKMRDQLRDSYSRYNDLYELAPVAFVVLDRQGRISEINAKCASLLGSKNGSLIGRPFLMFVATPDIAPFLDLMLRSTRIQKEESLEFTLNVDGHSTPVHTSMRT